MKTIVALFAVAIALPGFAAVKVAGEPVLTVAADGTASAIITLRNDEAKDVPLFLELDDFTNSAQAHATSTRKLALVDSTTAAGAFAKGTIAANGVARVAVDVANFKLAGNSSASLRNEGAVIGTLHAINENIAFNVAPATWKGDGPIELTAENGQVPITLKNTDPIDYGVKWTIVEDGRRVGEGRNTIARNSSLFIEQKIDERSDGLEGYFRDRQTDAMLILTAVPPSANDGAAEWTTRTFPLRIKHVLWSSWMRNVLTTVVTLALLLLGAAASLLMTYALPNQIRRSRLREKIASRREQIARFTDAIIPSARIGLSMERKRLNAFLDAAPVYSPDFDTIATRCEADTALYAREVDLLARIDEAYARVDELWQNTSTTGPTKLREACTLLLEAQRTVDKTQTSQEQLDAAEAKVAVAETILAAPQTLDDAFIETLTGRVTDCIARRGNLADPKVFDAFVKEVKELDAAVDTTFQTKANVNATNFSRLDFATTKIRLLLMFLATFDNFDAQRRQRCADLPQRMYDALRLHSFREFRRAEGFLEQLRDDVYASEIQAALAAKDVQIRFRPLSPVTNQTVDFEIMLKKPRLNAAAARQCFTPEWDFGDGFTGTGWEISHYFTERKEQNTFNVTVRFRDENGDPVKDQNGDVVVALPPLNVPTDKKYDRLKVEGIYLVVTIVLACVGLLTGASEQLAKLDLIAALVAIFLIGFSADQIKTALAGRK